MLRATVRHAWTLRDSKPRQRPDVCHDVRTSRVDGTRVSMHFETSLADEARHGPPRVGTMIWASRAALGADGRKGTDRVIHRRDEEPHRAGP